MRINIIDPSWLTDQHLIAEYREIKMMPKVLIRSIYSKKGIIKDKLPKEYTLNTGHGKFFYYRMQYIVDRFESIKKEMKERDFQCNHTKLFEGYNHPSGIRINSLDEIPREFFGNYVPNEKAIDILLERILLRISDKPMWYKLKGIPNEWESFYKENSSKIYKGEKYVMEKEII